MHYPTGRIREHVLGEKGVGGVMGGIDRRPQLGKNQLQKQQVGMGRAMETVTARVRD